MACQPVRGLVACGIVPTTPPRADAAPALIPAPRDDLCLDFANTVAWRCGEAPRERLPRFADLLAWCRDAGTLPAAAASLMAAAAAAAPEAAARCHAEALALRETIDRLFRARAGGAPVRASDLAALNAALARCPARDSLGVDAAGHGWRIGGRTRLWTDLDPGPDLPPWLVPLAWSAADLLSGPRLARLRQCADAQCGWLFLDTSRARRWCSMSDCGNRAKARRHYARHGKAG